MRSGNRNWERERETRNWSLPSCSMLTSNMPWAPGRSRSRSMSSCEAMLPCSEAGRASGDSKTGWMAMKGVMKCSRMMSCGSSTSTTLMDARPVWGSWAGPKQKQQQNKQTLDGHDIIKTRRHHTSHVPLPPGHPRPIISQKERTIWRASLYLLIEVGQE